ncbi:MAG: cyclic nucleotide-binding domain-containing protein [Planctomycetota bacterium]|jgi:CRP-like cAMP-binding protein
MSGKHEMLKGVSVFSSFTDEELAAIAEVAVEADYEEGAVVFEAGDPGSSMLAVIEGAVELVTRLSERVEKTFATARAGATLGVLSFFDTNPRPGMARAIERTKLLVFEKEAVDRFAERHPVAARKIFFALGSNMAGVVRLVIEEYRKTIQWGLEISGATRMNLDKMIGDRVKMDVELLNGSRILGTMLAAERSETGEESFFLKTDEGELRWVPSRAVAQASFEGDILEGSPDALPGL